MDALFAHWPWWVLAFVVVGSLLLARRFPWAKPLLAPVRAAALRRLRRERLHVVPAPPPLSDGGVAEDRELPPAEVVDGEANPVQMGRTPEEIEADEKAGGSGG